jgi:hypothetical protein
MPSLLDTNATILCPHGGSVTAIAGNFRVKTSQAPVVTLTDQFLVSGCAFAPSGVPSPCLQVMWFVGANRVTVGHLLPLVQSSTGMCISAAGIPQGPPMIVMSQIRAGAT